jgi:hypothetical protein
MKLGALASRQAWSAPQSTSRLEVREATLASVLAKADPGIRFNEHVEGDGPASLGC